MASQIEICNLALSHLGLNGIQSIAASSPSAIACNNNWEPSVKDALSEHRWPFANVKSELTLVSDAALELEWDYVYVYPIKALAIWNVYNEGTAAQKEEQEFETAFQVTENRKVLCSNNDSAYAEQTYHVADAEIYSPKFAIVLSYRLAANMGHILLGDTKVALKAFEIYSAIMHEAKRLSSSEKKKKPTQTSSSVASRA